jgi:hypothetical protein
MKVVQILEAATVSLKNGGGRVKIAEQINVGLS